MGDCFVKAHMVKCICDTNRILCLCGMQPNQVKMHLHLCIRKGKRFVSQQTELCVFRAQLRLRTFYCVETKTKRRKKV